MRAVNEALIRALGCFLPRMNPLNGLTLFMSTYLLCEYGRLNRKICLNEALRRTSFFLYVLGDSFAPLALRLDASAG
jgi:hypothetical protein